MKCVCLGDSITYGYPFDPKASWVNLVSHATGLPFINKGVNKETTGEMLKRFNTDVLNLKPTDIIVLGGTNDAWYKVNLKEVQKNITSMHQLANANRIRMHLALPIPVNEKATSDPYLQEALLTKPTLDEYRHWMKNYAQVQGIGPIDFYSPMLNPKTLEAKPELFADSGHPNQQGHQVMTATLLSYLISCNLIS